MASTAHAVSPDKDPRFEFFLRGGTAHVYKHRSEPRVAKLIARVARSKEEWISYPAWLDESGGKVSARNRMLIARQTLRVYRVLKQDPLLAELLPKTWMPGRGRIDQAWVTGLDLHALDPEARAVAEAEMYVVIARAQRLLPHLFIDEGVYNFKFDRQGHVKWWFDWTLVDPVAEETAGPPPRERSGTPEPRQASSVGRPSRIGSKVYTYGPDTMRVEPLVEKLSLQPHHVVGFQAARYSFSDPFELGDGRLAVLGVVDVAGERTVSLYWRSNSQGVFRLLPALNARTRRTGDAWFDSMPGFDKGIDENALNLPSKVQQRLAELVTHGQVRRDLTEADAAALLETLPPQYRTRKQYDEYEASEAHPRFHTRTKRVYRVTRGGGQYVAEPLHPDYSKLLGQSKMVTPLDGPVTVQRFPSRDRTLEYTVLVDADQRIRIADVQLRAPPLNRFGVPSLFVDAGTLLTPRWEYRFQIPKEHVGPAHPVHEEYASTWPLLRSRPEIKAYYRAMKLEVPGLERSPATAAADATSGKASH